LSSAEAVVCVVADRLREILADCPRCHGNAYVSLVYTCHRITNPLASVRWREPHVQVLGAGAAVEHVPCLLCWRVRQVVDLAENYQ
jgi:hypothetical protein